MGHNVSRGSCANFYLDITLIYCCPHGEWLPSSSAMSFSDCSSVILRLLLTLISAIELNFTCFWGWRVQYTWLLSSSKKKKYPGSYCSSPERFVSFSLCSEWLPACCCWVRIQDHLKASANPRFLGRSFLQLFTPWGSRRAPLDCDSQMASLDPDSDQICFSQL